MQTSGLPTRMPTPFADSGAKNSIPIPSQIAITPGAASFTDGFPPLTRTPLVAGGVPPYGVDFNGILNAVTVALRWANAGGSYAYDSAFSTAVGGYPKGAIVARAAYDGFWVNTTENNTTNPDTGGAGWVTAFPAGIVGQARNLKMTVATASASATLTADEVIVETALGGQTYRLASFSKTINLATTGAGGMDTGTAPVSGYVGIYAIFNPTSGVSALLAVNATAAVVPEVYGGANMPAGYTASALVSVVPTNSSSQFTVLRQVGRIVYFPGLNPYGTSTTTTTPTSFTIANAIPKNAVRLSGGMSFQGVTSGSNLQFAVSMDSSLTGAKLLYGVATAGASFISPFDIGISTAQTLWYTAQSSSGGATFSIYVSGYEF